MEMIVDTGFGGYLIGPLSLAQDLALPLQETLIQINATYYDGNSKYQAVDMRIEAAGREESDAVYVVYCEETPEDYRAPLIGSLFLMGMQLQFNADGSLEMSGRGMDAEWDDRIIRMVEQGLALAEQDEDPQESLEEPVATATAGERRHPNEE